MREEDRVAQIIESSLSNYGDPGMDSGLAERILAHVGSERIPPPSVTTWSSAPSLWAVALSAAACLLFAFFGLRTGDRQAERPPRQLQPQPTTSALVEQATPPRTSTAIHPPQSPHVRPSMMTAAKHASPPKLDQFPQPHALSPEEQALYVFATNTPEKQRQAVLEALRNDDAPLRVATLCIQPLEIPDTGKN
jgi:hypothetical protein